MGIRDDGESAVGIRVEAVVDEGEEGGAVRGSDESVCIIGLEARGCDKRASGEIRVGEEEEEILVVHCQSRFPHVGLCATVTTTRAQH